MSFSDATVRQKIKSLSGSQHSVATLSLWFQHHVAHADHCTKVWSESAAQADAKRKLVLLYLANDVLQASKGKTDAYHRSFGDVIAHVLCTCAMSGSDATKKAAARIVDVWKERGVFPPDFLHRVQREIAIGGTGQGLTLNGGPSGDTVDELEQVFESIASAAEGGDAKELETAVTSLNPSVFDEEGVTKIADKAAGNDLIAQVANACTVLATYQGHLVAEQEDQSTALRLLSTCLDRQRHSLRRERTLLTDYEKRQKRVTDVLAHLAERKEDLIKEKEEAAAAGPPSGSVAEAMMLAARRLATPGGEPETKRRFTEDDPAAARPPFGATHGSHPQYPQYPQYPHQPHQPHQPRPVQAPQAHVGDWNAYGWNAFSGSPRPADDVAPRDKAGSMPLPVGSQAGAAGPAMAPPAENVKVAVRVRPLNSAEIEARCRTVSHQVPGEPVLVLGERHQFTYDKVFPTDSTQEQVFRSCVRPLVDGAMEGRNATVLAYGQTGSGKTFSMGTGFDVDLPAELEGVVPRAVKHLFDSIEVLRAKAIAADLPPPEVKVTVSFLELYRSSFFDLFDSSPGKEAAHIKIIDRKNEDGAVTGVDVTGMIKVEAGGVEEVMGCLRRGSLARVTASTDMNEQSSRSHAVFTLWVTHRRTVVVEGAGAVKAPSADSQPKEAAEEDGEEGGNASEGEGSARGSPDSGAPSPEPAKVTDIVTTTAKFNFVDLAGSERLKRTGATGARAKEGIDINSGLLALGNVISALGDASKRATHIPYRDSKLTRMLQDSLGGNSRTLMIACVSPADRDFVETLNTLRYANRTRNIKNTVVVNQDSASREIQFLREMLNKLQIELMEYKQGRRGSSAEAGDVVHEVNYLNQEVASLKRKVAALKSQNAALEEQLVAAQVDMYSGSGEAGTAAVDADAGGDVRPATSNGPPAEAKEAWGEGTEAPAAVASPTAAPVSRNVRGQIESVVRENLRLKTELAEAKAAAEEAASRSASSRRSAHDMNVQDPSRPATARHSQDFLTRPGTSTAIKVASIQRIQAGRAVLETFSPSVQARAKSRLSKENVVPERDGPQTPEGGSESDGSSGEEEEGDGKAEADAAAQEGEGEEGEPEEEEEEEEAPEEEEEMEEPNEAEAEAVLPASHQKLLHELTMQIDIQEKLLDELNVKENELIKQRQLYERKLSDAKKERDRIMAERERLTREMGKVDGKGDKNSKKMQKQYEKRLKELQNKINKMSDDAKKGEREMEQKRMAVSQLETLRKSLKDAKLQRRTLVEEGKQELKVRREKEKARMKEMMQLKKDQNKAKLNIQKLERVAEAKTKQYERSVAENAKLKQELKARKEDLKKVQSGAAKSVRKSFRAASPASNTSPGRDVPVAVKKSRFSLRRTSNRVAQKEAARKKALLDKELSRAAMYRRTQADAERLVHQRDTVLNDQRSKLLEEKTQLDGSDAADKEERARDIVEELGRVDMETEMVNQAISDRHKQLLTLETSGVTACAHTDNMSEAGNHIIEGTDQTQARLLLKDFFVKLVQQQLATSEQQIRLKELELELERKDSLLRSFVSSGVSKKELTSPTKPPAADAMEGLGDIAEQPLDAGKPTPVALRTRGRAATMSTTSRSSRSGSTSPHSRRASDRRRSLSPAQTSLKGMTRPTSAESSVGGEADMPGSSSRPSSSAGGGGALVKKAKTFEFTVPSKPSAKSYVDPGISTFKTSLRSGSAATRRKVAKSIADEIIPERPATSRKEPSKILTLSHTIRGHDDEVLCVAAYDNTVLSGSKDKTVRVWDMQEEKLKGVLKGHDYHVKAVVQIPSQFFTASKGTVRLWDARTNECMQSYVMKKNTRVLLKDHSDVSSLQVHPQGNTMYASCGKYLRVWDLRMSEEVKVVRLQAKITSLALHADRDWLAVGCMDHKVRVYDVNRVAESLPAPLVLEPPHYDQVTCVAFARRTLYSGSRDFSLKRWDAVNQGESWKNSHTQSNAHGTGSQVTCVSAVSEDPNSLSCIVSGSAKGSLKIWDPVTSQSLGEAMEHSAAVNAFAVAGSRLYTASSDRTVKVWQYNEPEHVTQRRVEIERRQRERTDRRLSTQDTDGIFGLPSSMDTPDVEMDEFLANALGSPEQNRFSASFAEEDAAAAIGGGLNNTFTVEAGDESPAATPQGSPKDKSKRKKTKSKSKGKESPKWNRALSRIPVTPTRPTKKSVQGSPRIEFSV